MYSPYDFNQSIAHRAEYVEERLKSGAPVIGISYDKGVLLFTVKRTQRKIFEIYDQLIFGAIGNQADIEAVRLAAIDFAHQEGFTRSPDDVSIQRLVGFAISPPIKRGFGDPMTSPHVLRALFAEVGKTPQQDSLFVLNYDGEFTTHQRYAVAAGSAASEDAMLEELEKNEEVPTLQQALKLAAAVWRKSAAPVRETAVDDESDDQSDSSETATTESDPLEEALKTGTIEAGVLERDTARESKFRLLKAEEIEI